MPFWFICLCYVLAGPLGEIEQLSLEPHRLLSTKVHQDVCGNTIFKNVIDKEALQAA